MIVRACDFEQLRSLSREFKLVFGESVRRTPYQDAKSLTVILSDVTLDSNYFVPSWNFASDPIFVVSFVPGLVHKCFPLVISQPEAFEQALSFNLLNIEANLCYWSTSLNLNRFDISFVVWKFWLLTS